MQLKQFQFSVEVYSSSAELSADDAALLAAARDITAAAYAPYSNFYVGAAAKLMNGEIVTGTNQENASFPAGLCAERVLLSTASVLYPTVAIETIAISYHSNSGNSKEPISPCGICRQTLSEYENRFSHPIRLILGGMEGKVYIFEKAGSLLPLAFTSKDLNQE